jgi:hypothetical protein
MSCFKDYLTEWSGSSKPRDAQPTDLTTFANQQIANTERSHIKITPTGAPKWVMQEQLGSNKKESGKKIKGEKRKQDKQSSSSAKKQKTEKPKVICHYCEKVGHTKKECRKLAQDSKSQAVAMIQNPQWIPPPHQQWYYPPPPQAVEQQGKHQQASPPPPQPTSNTSHKGSKKGGECMFVYYSNDNIFNVVGVVNLPTPGGGDKMIVNIMIINNNILIPCRMWIDSGAQISLISEEFVQKHNLQTRGGP